MIGLLDRGQFVAAGAAVGVTGASTVAWDFDANPTATALVAAGQQGPSLVVRHSYHPHPCRGPGSARTFPVDTGDISNASPLDSLDWPDYIGQLSVEGSAGASAPTVDDVGDR